MRKELGLLLLLCGSAACGEAAQEEPAPETTVRLTGAVEKGPFVLGSSVVVSITDERAEPTGEVFNTFTNSDLGEFDVSTVGGSYVSIEATGYYYNELSGTVSAAPLTLRALHQLGADEQAQVFVNVVTHLSFQRVRKLIADGVAFGEAIMQAEAELVVSLGIGPPGLELQVSGSEMNIAGGDTSANAYLLALSSVLIQTATLQGGPVEGALQEIVNSISADLADDGSLEAGLVEEVQLAQRVLNPDQIVADLAARLASLGSSASVPDVNAILDSDGDGTVNAEEEDDDNDGVADSSDLAPYDPALTDVSWCDGTSNLCWQHDPPSEEMLSPAAQSYCDSLELGGYTDWRLPTIDELRTLIRGCPVTEPSGACHVTGSSSEADWTDACLGCWGRDGDGPGQDGCYWDPRLSGACGTYWSSSIVADEPGTPFVVVFVIANVAFESAPVALSARCVRQR